MGFPFFHYVRKVLAYHIMKENHKNISFIGTELIGHSDDRNGE